MASLRIFVGIFCMTAVHALSLMWGNLSVYTTSYFHFRGHEEVGLDTSWAVAANTAAWSVGMMLSVKIAGLIGFRCTTAAALAVFNGAMLLCFLAVQHSFIAFILAFGLVCGFSQGVLQAQQIILITLWSQPRFLGLGCGGILCFQQIGAVLMNVVITYFINPNNLRPDTLYLNAKLFSQQEVLDRVPNVFIVHGSVSLILAITSFIFVNLKPKKCEYKKSEFETNETKNSVNTEHSTTHEDVTSNTNETCFSESSGSIKSEGSSSKISETTYLKRHEDKTNGEKSKGKSDELKKESSDVTPKQALKTMSFYALLMLAVHTDITFIILSTYYKMFGMLYYPDDHFFTNTSVALNGGSVIVVALAGILCDKCCVKTAIIANSCLLCLLSGTFFLTVQVDKWLYFVCVVLCAGSVNANYLMTTIGMLKYFGKSHSTTLYGMAMSVSLVTNTVTPPLIHSVLSIFGWLTIYTSVGVINLIGIIVVVIGLPVLKCDIKTSHDN